MVTVKACFLQPDSYGVGGEEHIVEVKNVSLSGGSKLLLPLEGLMVPSQESCFK